MSRRSQIAMTKPEVERFVRDSKTIILCSTGPGGYPHPIPMWFAVAPDGSIRMTTYARSQKIRNLERDPRVSLLVESGEEYSELRGVVLYGTAELVRDVEQIIDTLLTASGRGDAAAPEVRDAMRAQASKRTLICVKPERVVSWDHRKLGGVY